MPGGGYGGGEAGRAAADNKNVRVGSDGDAGFRKPYVAGDIADQEGLRV